MKTEATTNVPTSNPNLNPEPQDTTESNSDWLAQRKEELREIMEQKSKELSKRAQQHVSQKLNSYESALNQASEQLESDSEARPAKVSRELASKIHKTADYIENTSPEEILNDTSKAVKAAPLLTLAGALVAGLAVGRILSQARKDDAQDDKAQSSEIEDEKVRAPVQPGIVR